MPSTKIELNSNKISRIRDPDELARVLFPGNRNHQGIFLAVFIELKYAPDQVLPGLDHLCDQYGFTRRSLETVRAKMRRMGLIDHVSRFNQTYGYREGWVFSNRFCGSLKMLLKLFQEFKERRSSTQEQKDRDLFRYL